MALTIFDLDNTLLDGDSDYLWGTYLVDQGVVDGEYYERENQRFYDEYKVGTLDIFEFLKFSLLPLAENSLQDLLAMREAFMQQKIMPIILPKARTLVASHRDKGDELLIITATNRFVTEPIAQELGIDNLIATDPEQVNNHYTGNVAGIPCFREGKVTRLEQWLKATGHNLSDSRFYSDSHNDLPLLEMVSCPVAVDPDDTLLNHAGMKQWQVISLR